MLAGSPGSDWRKWTAFTNWDEVDQEAVEEGSCLSEEEMEALGLLLEDRGDSRRLDRPESCREESNMTEAGQAEREGPETDEDLLLPEVESCGQLRYLAMSSPALCQWTTVSHFNFILGIKFVVSVCWVKLVL